MVYLNAYDARLFSKFVLLDYRYIEIWFLYQLEKLTNQTILELFQAEELFDDQIKRLKGKCFQWAVSAALGQNMK